MLYGLGTENQNLPGFIVMCPGGYPIAESQNWQSAFLPGIYQGTYIDTQHTEIEKLIAEHPQPRRRPRAQQRASSTCWRELNQRHLEQRQQRGRSSRRASSRSSWPIRMQTEAADAFDVSRRSRETIRDMYGPGVQARQILIARRLLERGVRFVQLWHGAGQPWDNHDDLEADHRELGQPVRPGRSPRSSRT